MKRILFYGISLSVLMMSGAVRAADWQSEVNKLREDVTILQRQVYRGIESNTKSDPERHPDVQVKISQYDEQIRKINGRLDELEHSIKQNNNKIDQINRDMQIRLKILEGRQVPASLSAPAPQLPKTYAAPVATDAAPAVVGEKIHGDDLAPIGGEQSTKDNSDNENEPKALIPAAKEEPVVPEPANNPDDIYNNAMQAFNHKLYDEAEIAFEDVLNRFPAHKLAGNSQYWLGEIYARQGNLQKAKTAFWDGYQKYKNGYKAADSFYRLGMMYEALKDKEKACTVFTNFAGEFPKAEANLLKKSKEKAKALGCK